MVGCTPFLSLSIFVRPLLVDLCQRVCVGLFQAGLFSWRCLCECCPPHAFLSVIFPHTRTKCQHWLPSPTHRGGRQFLLCARPPHEATPDPNGPQPGPELWALQEGPSFSFPTPNPAKRVVSWCSVFICQQVSFHSITCDSDPVSPCSLTQMEIFRPRLLSDEQMTA